MNSSRNQTHNRIIVDSIHGDIHLNDQEWEIIDTPSFQRLRHLKQLAMAHLTYPGATHTRFSHSLGTFAIMSRILKVPGVDATLDTENQENLRMAALLHDIGHYPYSHMMERVDQVRLTEELIETSGGKKKTGEISPYPSHTEVGALIVTVRPDLIKAIGSEERAQAVADIFTGRKAAGPQISKLIKSSLDMDRLDYLPRDSHATGVPYGRIDINYLLNNLQISPSGLLGISIKALPAAEHFLLARFFMHRTVYYHKTTYGMEEACRQLLRRIRDKKIRKEGNHAKYHIPVDEKGVLDLADSEELVGFTDAYVDRLIGEATKDNDEVIRTLALAIQSRRPPKLLKSVETLIQKGQSPHVGTIFRQNCIHGLRNLSEEFKIPLGQFLLCETKPLRFEERGSLLTAQEARKIVSEEKDELIKVFNGTDLEPVSIVDIHNSLILLCAGHFFQAFRLYVVYEGNDREKVIADLREKVKDWDQSS